jgi:hypothetical protein
VDPFVANEITLASESLPAGFIVAGEGAVAGRLVSVDEISDVHGEGDGLVRERESVEGKKGESGWVKEGRRKASGLEETKKQGKVSRSNG